MISFRQGLHKGTKLIAAVSITFEHVERGSAWREQHRLTRFRQSARALNCVGQGIRHLARHCVAPVTADPFRHLADQNGRARLFGNERLERIKSESLVLATRDQDHWFALREKRLLDRIEIGRFRVVYPTDSAYLADELAAMRPRFIRTERRLHFRKRKSARHTDSQCGHQILNVVQAAQLDLRQTQDRFVLIDDRASRQTKIRAVSVGAERQRPRRDGRQIFVCVYDRDVIGRLIIEDAQLGRAIFPD